ncbi:MAG: aldehyde ferredoxin oxidoreductase N-terminal domain-containing protein, partial [Chloroflexota bacterium]
MVNGYAGRWLTVDLDSGRLSHIELPQETQRDLVGGYGIGARLLLERTKAGVNPLGPENILGFCTGPLTGTPSPFGNRYTIIGLSPLTLTWGDASSGGDFGPYLKFAGYDGILFCGTAPRPTYLLIDNGSPSLRDASHLWGKDTYETEKALHEEYGRESRIACIGPAGEKLSLISSVINDHGRAAGRSGLGAVMGSKR